MVITMYGPSICLLGWQLFAPFAGPISFRDCYGHNKVDFSVAYQRFEAKISGYQIIKKTQVSFAHLGHPKYKN